MPTPSSLSIATKSVDRLVKDVQYYQKELKAQAEKIKKMTAELPTASETDSNAEYLLKQEQTALEQTEAVFGPLYDDIAAAVQRLEVSIATAESEDGPAEEIAKAKKAVELGTSLTQREAEGSDPTEVETH